VSSESLNGEFSHVVEVEQIAPEGVLLQLTANTTECAALARRFHILNVVRLAARVQVRPDSVVPGCYVVKGQLEAEVEQACVVSLEPVRQRIEESFARGFAPGAGEAAAATDNEDEAEWLDPEAADPPDPLIGGRIDIGEVVAEELALALDPYPRKPDAGLPPEYRPEPDESGKVSPFAVLAKLKAEKKD